MNLLLLIRSLMLMYQKPLHGHLIVKFHHIVVSGVIGNGAGAVTKTDAGNVTLTGTNTYTGLTTVLGGTLILDQAGVTDVGTVIDNSAAVTVNGGTLQLNDRVEVFDTLTLTSGSVTVSSSGNAITANTYLLNPTSGTTHAIYADLGLSLIHISEPTRPY